MRVGEVEQFRDDLAEYTADVFGSLTRAGWQDRAGWYLHGLMLDGRRKSIQPMAARLDGAVHEQALNHFVTNSPWPVQPVRARIAELVDKAVAPVAWAMDDTGLLKCGTASPCVGVSTPAPRGRSPTARSPCRSAWSPTPRRARSTGGCSCPSPGIRPHPRQPRTCTSGAARPA